MASSTAGNSLVSPLGMAMDDQTSGCMKLREILVDDELTVMPCCYDGLSARLVEAAGFNLTFMTGSGVSATYGLPDTGLISAAEMVTAANTICGALKRIPCIADGDTGYGNPANVKRTVRKYIQAGMAGIMIEDQGGYTSTYTITSEILTPQITNHSTISTYRQPTQLSSVS